MAKLAASGKNIRALYNRTKPGGALTNLRQVEWMHCDLLDVFAVEEAFAGITEVYHAAAVVSFSGKDRERVMQVNVDATANVVNEALLHPVRKFVHISSVAALGRNQQQKTITEDEQWEESAYNSVYGLSKHLAEMEVWRGAGEGLPVVVLNPGIILGEPLHGEAGWDNGSAALMQVVNREFPFYTAGINSFVDVEDVASVAIALMNHEVTDERFIISAGNFPYREVFTKMAHALGKKPPHIAAGKWMTALVWRWQVLRAFFTGKAATVTKETAATAQRQSFYDNNKLFRFLPDFQYAPLDDTIARMATTFLQRSK